MKQSVICIILVFSFNGIAAQSVNFGFNSTHSGRNVTGQFEFQDGKNEYSLGLGYNINIRSQDDQGHMFKKRLYATENIHFLNVDLTWQRYILTDRIKNIQPFFFYDIQGKYSTTRNRLFSETPRDSAFLSSIGHPDANIYLEQVYNLGPFFWIENNIGLGFKAMLTDRFYIKQRFGVGADFMLRSKHSVMSYAFSKFSWEFSSLLHFSVGMMLHSKS